MKASFTFTKAALLLTSIYGLSSAKAADAISFDMMHTVQTCQPVPGHQPTFCSLTDMKPSAEATGLEKKLTGLLDRALKNPEKAHVYASEYSFSDHAIQDKMCALGAAGVSVEIYVDYASQADVQFTHDPKCQKDPASPNLHGNLLGGFAKKNAYRLHHNKTVLIDTGDGSPVDIGFSSGNLSAFGLSLHMDHWVLLTAPPESNIVRATQCLFVGLDSALEAAQKTGMYSQGMPDFSKDPAVMSAYMQSREDCYQQKNVIPMNDPETAIAKEGIAPFFTPNSNHFAINTFISEIGKVKAIAQSGQPAYIYIAIEHFLNKEIAVALNQAANAGVDVRVLMNSGTVSGKSEVSDDLPFYIASLKPGKMKIRFLETNPDAGGNGQQMHNKYAILNGKRVFSGAGHYTTAGLDGNFETLYLTQNDNLTTAYKKYFRELWKASVDESYLVNHTANSAPAALVPEVENVN